MNIGPLLIHARHKAGLSQRELAEAAGIPQPAIARWETGRVVPNVDSLARVLEACGHEIVIRPRRGVGVDRSMIRELLKLSPAERVRRAAVEGMNLER